MRYMIFKRKARVKAPELFVVGKEFPNKDVIWEKIWGFVKAVNAESEGDALNNIVLEKGYEYKVREA